jgi:hypothetical protein
VQLTEEQYGKMKSIFDAAYDYSIMIKEHNSAKSELFTNFLDELCPKPSGKMSQIDKENFKDQKKETKQFIMDTYRIYLRDKDNKADTTAEALTASEKLV